MTLSEQFAQRRSPGMFRMPANRTERAMARAVDGLRREERERLEAEVRDDSLARVVNAVLEPIGRAVGA